MQKYVIALYIRLSLEDYKYDSMSIENQHLALSEFEHCEEVLSQCRNM